MIDIGAIIFSIFYQDPLTGLLMLLEIAALIIIIIRFRRRRKNAKKLEQQNRSQMMAKLTEGLSNPLYLEHEGKPNVKLEPIETNWTENPEGNSDDIRVELEVRGTNVRRKYSFIIQDPITIGKSESCSITISDETLEDRHLELFLKKGQLMVRKLCTQSMAVLEREHDYKKLDENAIRVVDNDIIRLGYSELIIELIS